jgi:prepilin peptidase CpaA
MSELQHLMLLILIPLTLVISYYDVKYRRIPNKIVLLMLLIGFVVNLLISSFNGFVLSISGAALAFALMLILHIVGAMGAGDVKLFAAIGSLIGFKLILPTYLIIAIVGGLLAIISSLYRGTLFTTFTRVTHILFSILNKWDVPRYSVPENKSGTIPYGIAITVGSSISVYLNM